MKVRITLEYEKVVDFPEEQIFKEHQRQSYIAGIVFELERLERMPEWKVEVIPEETQWKSSEEYPECPF